MKKHGMKGKPVKVASLPIYGKAAHNAGFMTAIGQLVVNWGNNESVFLAMLQVLIVGGEHTAALVWHSHRTTRSRLDLVHRLCRERVQDQQLLSDLTAAVSAFHGFSKVRNFYCHATYRYDTELYLASDTGATTPQEGEPIAFQTKVLDLGALNEITDVSAKLAQFNQRLWLLVERLQTALGTSHVELPAMVLQQRDGANAEVGQAKAHD